MTERYTPFSDFDSAAVAEVLGAESRATHDVAHGLGETLTLRDGAAELEVYPTTGVARVTTKNARVELFRIPRYSLGQAHVVFEHGEDDDRTGLRVAGDGKVSFRPILRATGNAPAAETVQSAPVDQPTSQTSSEDVTDQESEERREITMSGRLGRDPWFSRESEALLAGFPLAVNGDRDNTTWHKVVARDEAAEQVNAGKNAGYIRQGRQVIVRGYFDVQTGKGKPTFEATAVERPQATKDRPNRQRA